MLRIISNHIEYAIDLQGDRTSLRLIVYANSKPYRDIAVPYPAHLHERIKFPLHVKNVTAAIAQQYTKAHALHTIALLARENEDPRAALCALFAPLFAADIVTTMFNCKNRRTFI